MKTPQDPPRNGLARNPLQRRDILKTLGLGAAGAAAATMLPAGDEAQAMELPQEQVKSRYRETEHVKRFYALNRL
ncbi:twin-arginine translocation signal domain-containing protein (plasmid) [Azospirillum sp. A29]|uniref:twin-arginine translocation signal domain-containing protein n=1 Tax=Azospirillum sp. A29 TaxID=3160606 RepID=UPI00366EDF1D